MTGFVGRFMFSAGMDRARWEISVGVTFRLKVAHIMVGPLYVEVSW